MKEAQLIKRLEDRLFYLKGRACLLVRCKEEELPNWNPQRPYIKYPETGLGVQEQLAYMSNLLNNSSQALASNILIITRSPYIITDFHREEVLVREENNFKHPDVNTFGTSISSIECDLLHLSKNMGGIAQAFIDDLFTRSKKVDNLKDIETLKEASRKLGMSVQKVFLFNALIFKEKELKKEAL
jgi:hypothetical protein